MKYKKIAKTLLFIFFTTLILKNTEYDPRIVHSNDKFKVQGKVLGKYHVD